MCLETTQPINSSPPLSLFSFSSRRVLLTWSFWQKRQDLRILFSPISNKLNLDWFTFLVLKEIHADFFLFFSFLDEKDSASGVLFILIASFDNKDTHGDLVFLGGKVSASGVFCSPPLIHMINRPLSDLTSISLYYGRKTCNISQSFCCFKLLKWANWALLGV